MNFKSPVRVLALALTLALLTVSFPVNVFATAAEQDQSESGVYDTEATFNPDSNYTADTVMPENDPEEMDLSDVTVIAEDVSKRDEFEKHYILSNGCMVAVTYPEAAHYHGENGLWRDVNNTLELDAKTGRIVSKNDDFKVSFAESASKENLVEIENRPPVFFGYINHLFTVFKRGVFCFKAKYAPLKTWRSRQ